MTPTEAAIGEATNSLGMLQARITALAIEVVAQRDAMTMLQTTINDQAAKLALPGVAEAIAKAQKAAAKASKP